MKKGYIQPAVIAVIRNDKGQYLMTKRIDLEPKSKRFHNCWQFPGGGIEFGETPEEALQREMREEIGISVYVLKLFPEVYTVVRARWQGVFLIYLCRLSDENATIILNEEASEYGWFSNLEIKKLKSLPSTDFLIENAEKLT